MDDNCYVSLTLEKYNEVYDKAKKYDKILEENNNIPVVDEQIRS